MPMQRRRRSVLVSYCSSAICAPRRRGGRAARQARMPYCTWHILGVGPPLAAPGRPARGPASQAGRLALLYALRRTTGAGGGRSAAPHCLGQRRAVAACAAAVQGGRSSSRALGRPRPDRRALRRQPALPVSTPTPPVRTANTAACAAGVRDAHTVPQPLLVHATLRQGRAHQPPCTRCCHSARQHMHAPACTCMHAHARGCERAARARHLARAWRRLGRTTRIIAAPTPVTGPPLRAPVLPAPRRCAGCLARRPPPSGLPAQQPGRRAARAGPSESAGDVHGVVQHCRLAPAAR